MWLMAREGVPTWFWADSLFSVAFVLTALVFMVSVARTGSDGSLF